MNTERVALIGAGYFAQFHLDGWRTTPDAAVLALADPNRDAAATLAARYQVPATYDDAATMLDRERPSLVDIVTPPTTHRALVGLALERRIPVICQKPLAPTYAEARAIVEDAERAKVPLVVHENFRWQPWYREAKRLIDAGMLGALHGVAFRLRPGDGQGPRAYLDRQPYFQTMPRLLVHETAIHWVDTFRYLCGEVATVYAQLRRLNPVIAGEDAGVILFEFASGAVGLFDGNRLNDHVANNPRRTMGELWLEGAKGVLRLDGDARLWWKPHQGVEQEHRYDAGPTDTFAGGCCGALQRHVVRHLRGDGSLENSGRSYLTNVLIEEAIYASAASGKRIALADFDDSLPH